MARKKNNITLVREYIRSLIASKGLRAGDMLPCEGEIADALEISKSSVREATHALESIGLIEIRHGIGLFLRGFNLDAMGDIFDYGFLLDPRIVLDLYDLRRQLETSLMPRVVANVGNEQIERCEALLEEWEILAREDQPTYDVDGRFHDTLYSVIDNRMLTSLCHIFWNAYRDLETSERIGREKPRSAESARQIIEDHRRILEAVRSRDGQLASKLMYEHFTGLIAEG